ncbi:MAG: geranylgeranyl reductase family protein, partial [Chloroflexota bacterium]
MNQLWDVVIVGAGPSGSTLGYELAKSGLRVVILDKEIFPRYKPCGGGLTIKTVNRIGTDLTSIFKDTIYGTYLTYRMQDEHTLNSDMPIAFTVNRTDFDYFLLKRAQAAGCDFLEGEKARNITFDERSAAVMGDVHTYTGRIIVGADGANGIVAKSMGLMEDAFIGVSIESEVEVNSSALDLLNQHVLLDLGSVFGGYGWVFPKEDHLSIGVAGPQERAAEVQAYYQAFSDHWKKNLNGYRLIQKRGHRLPVRHKGSSIQRGRVLLVGDSAGLTEPLSGEGIYYAVYSGQLAARAIKSFFD